MHVIIYNLGILYHDDYYIGNKIKIDYCYDIYVHFLSIKKRIFLFQWFGNIIYLLESENLGNLQARIVGMLHVVSELLGLALEPTISSHFSSNID